jgi:membrane peptidoglycan carboxypeptidase
MIVPLFFGAFSAMVLVAIGVLGVILVTYESYAKELVPPDQLDINRPSTGAKILDRNGNLLYQYIDDEQGIRKPVPLSEVSPAFLAATIATEDSSFFENPGINTKGLLRAASENIGPLLGGESLEGTGGSSITQQLVKNVYIPEDQRHERSLDRKVREIVYSIELTKRYSKAQILEWYVNQISYGGIYTGVEAASEGYFGKPAKDLTLAEASLLAGIPQSPAAYDPITSMDGSLARRNQVLDLLSRFPEVQIGDGATYTVNPDEVAAARAETPVIQPQQVNIEAPHFVLTYVFPQLEQLVGKDALLHDGLTITTSLDVNLQHQAEDSVRNWVDQFEAVSNTHNGAAIVIEPSTGQILAMVGSIDYFNQEIHGNVNNLLGLNSPGSSFKPFIYLYAMMKFGWTPGTTLQDTPVTFRESDGSTFSPENPNHKYNGNVSLRNALGNSLNVTAFKTAQALGPDNIVKFARSVGITDINGQYGPSIAIGGIDLKALDLAYAYTALANNGVLHGMDVFAPARADERDIQPVSILKITDREGATRFDINQHMIERRVAPAAQTYMITDILADPNALCITFGCGGLSVPGYKVAMKTGTSEPYDPEGPDAGKIGETWAFGYTPDYVVGMWAGNSDNAPIVNIYSTSISYRSMRDILLDAYDGRPQTPFPRPEDVVTKQSCVSVPVPQPQPQPQPQEGQPNNGDNGNGNNRPNQPEQPQQPQFTRSCTSDLGVR